MRAGCDELLFVAELATSSKHHDDGFKNHFLTRRVCPISLNGKGFKVLSKFVSSKWIVQNLRAKSITPTAQKMLYRECEVNIGVKPGLGCLLRMV